MDVYMNLSDGKERLIIDGSWQLFGRLLESVLASKQEGDKVPSLEGVVPQGKKLNGVTPIKDGGYDARAK